MKNRGGHQSFSFEFHLVRSQWPLLLGNIVVSLDLSILMLIMLEITTHFSLKLLKSVKMDDHP